MGRKSASSARLGPALLSRYCSASLPARIVFGLPLLLAIACTGCRDRGTPTAMDAAQLEAWADLPGARASSNVALQRALTQVVEQGGTPRQMIPAPLPEDENVAMALADLFEPQQLTGGLLQTERLMPGDTFQVEPKQRTEVALLLRSADHELQQLEVAIRRPACQFATQFQRGFFAARTYIDVVTLCVRLEALQVATLLDQNRPRDAVAPLQVMFRLTAWLADDKLVSSRLTAARLRAVSLAAVARWVAQPQLTQDDLRGMSQTVDQLLEDWPDDANAWIGDRAVALHSYEVIRAGHLLSLLTPAETDTLRAEGLLEGLSDRLAESIDRDERFYLEAMGKIIASCEFPYFRRQTTLTDISQQLHRLRGSSDFPFAAGRLFLAGTEQGHYQQAEDRALCEAWSLALALAAGRARPSYHTSPLTGVVYAVDVTPQHVKVVTGPAGEMVIEVPRPAAR